MRTRQLKPGMKLNHPVVDRLGRNLVARGAELDDYMIDSLLKLGIMSVYIQEGEEEENPEQVPTSPEAEKNIERLRTEDRAKVTLSASIRERVSTGIQFIYNNTTSEEMVATTESIADDLMRSIKSNDAIAIDISTLKTSDEYTFKHSVDVATISMIVAKQQGLSPEEVREIGVCGLLHDIGKTKEISAFPVNDYTDAGQFLGHIVMGSEMVGEKIRDIEGFPPMLAMELKHCILAHHGEYEFGSPKKPALIEAVALNRADDTDAKMETFTEILEATEETGWLGFNRFFESNLRNSSL